MKIIISFLTLFLCNFYFSQNYFNKTYTKPWHNIASAVSVTESNYYVVGIRLDSLNRKLTFYKTDLKGDTILTKVFPDDIRFFYPRKILKRGTNLFVYGSAFDTTNSSNAKIFLMSFDEEFNLNWFKNYGSEFYNSGSDLLSLPNKNFILAGSYSSSSSTPEDFYLAETDSLGNLLWEKTYGGINYDCAFSLVKNNKNGYIISGQSESYSSNMDVLTINVDSLGNILWQKTYGLNAPLLTYGGQMCKLSDKSYIVEKNVLNENTNTTIAKVLKINEEGNVIWEKTFTTNPTYTSLEAAAPFELNDGTIILGGISYNDNLRYTGLIYKLDPLGNEIWHKEYERNPIISQYLVDIKPTNDAGLVFCGSAFDSVGLIKAWLVKLDCFGCDSTLCYYQDSVCNNYDCTQFPIDASFTASTNLVDFSNNQAVIFTNNSINTSNRFWSFGDDSLAYTNSSFSHLYSDTGTYQVQLVVYHGMCSDTLTQTVIVSNNIGINEKQMNDLISIYPNPNNGSFSINLLSLKEEITSIELIDELGRNVQFNSKEISPSILEIREQFAKGIYSLKITAKNKQEIIKKISIQ